MRARLQRCRTLVRRVHQQAREQLWRTLVRERAEELAPRIAPDRRQLEFRVVRIHCGHVLLRGRAHHFNDLHELVNTAVTGEHRLADEHLANDAAGTPNVDGGGVVGAAKDELRRPIIPAADVCNVRLALHEHFGGAEIAELKLVAWADKQILGLDVTVADIMRVDVCERAEELERVQTSKRDGHAAAVLAVLLVDAINSIG